MAEFLAHTTYRDLTEINKGCLTDEVSQYSITNSFSANFLYINFIEPNQIDFYYDGTLTAGEQGELNTIVNNHSIAICQDFTDNDPYDWAEDIGYDNTDTRFEGVTVQDVIKEMSGKVAGSISQEFDEILQAKIDANNGDLALSAKICPAGTNQSTNVISLEDSNIIYLNGDVDNPLARLDRGEVFNFDASQGDRITSIRGCYVVTTTFGTMVWNSIAFAGRYFFTESIRNSNPIRFYVNTYGSDTTVTITKNGVLDSTTQIDANTAVEINATGNGEYFIQADEYISVFAIGDNNSTDSRPLPPASSELLWFNSSTAVSPNTAKVAVLYPDTEIEYWFQNGVHGTATVQPGTSFALPNSQPQYDAEGGCFIKSNGIIGATNAADQDGSNGTGWISSLLATYVFGLPQDSQHATFVSRFKGSIKVYLPGQTTPTVTLNLIQSGTAVEDGFYPYAVKDTNRSAGTIYEADVPCNAVFDESSGDETLLVGCKPERNSIIRVNGKIGNVNLAIDDLTDVDITGGVNPGEANEGEILVYETGSWKNKQLEDDLKKLYVPKENDYNFVNSNTTYVINNWGTPEVEDSTYSMNSSTGILTINEDGWYDVSLHWGARLDSGSGSCNIEVYIEEDTGSGFGIIPSCQSSAWLYFTNGDNSSAMRCIRQYSTGDEIRIRANVTDPDIELEGRLTGLTVLKLENNVAVVGGGGGGTPTGVVPRKLMYYADQFENPTNNNWAVNELSAVEVDPTNNSMLVRTFDDSTEEGVGFGLYLDSDYDNFNYTITTRSAIGTGFVEWKIYYREIPNGSALGSWNTLDTVVLNYNNTDYIYLNQNVDISGLNRDLFYQFQLTRNGAGASDTKTGDAFIYAMKIELTE
jgi:hypothetical protein